MKQLTYALMVNFECMSNIVNNLFFHLKFEEIWINKVIGICIKKTNKKVEK